PVIKNHAMELCKLYPMQKSQIQHWWQVCKTQFPIYLDYWKKHPDVKNRKTILPEYTFKVPYKLPNGTTVYLRGKFDSVDSIGGKIYLQENKCKGDIDQNALTQQLRFDL